MDITGGTRSVASESRDRAYDAVSRIHFDGAQYRRDIGHRAIG